VEEFDNNINSPENDGTAILSPNGQVLVFTRCYVNNEYDAWCKLMMSMKRGEEWTDPVAFIFQKEKANYGQPAFAANGTTLFFSSDVEGGLGEHDIYYTQLDEKGDWIEPVNMGSLINSAGEEEYPTVYKDTLYYSSDHFAGLVDWIFSKRILTKVENGLHLSICVRRSIVVQMILDMWWILLIKMKRRFCCQDIFPPPGVESARWMISMHSLFMQTALRPLSLHLWIQRWQKNLLTINCSWSLK
jgi:hypothetical protein